MTGTTEGMSVALKSLMGRIPDREYDALADLETARVLTRYLLERMGEEVPTTTWVPGDF